MNNKNLVALSENELENISGGVNKKALGDAVEYGTAAVSTAVFSVVGQLLGSGIGNKIVGEHFFDDFSSPLMYVPGVGPVLGLIGMVYNICKKDLKFSLSSSAVFACSTGGGAGGWFAGRALGKAIRKKLGL